MTLQREDPRARITFRVSKEQKEAYRAALDDMGNSMSEDLREHVEAVTSESERSDGGQDLPPLLADALRALGAVADHRGRVPTSVAKSRIAEVTRLEKEAVVRCAIRPLDELGHVDVPKMGVLELAEPAPTPDSGARGTPRPR